MATIAINTPTIAGVHEARANKMREAYGENTIVWFTRQAYYAIYGKDADITAEIFGIVPEYMQYKGEFVAYLAKAKYEWRTAKAIAQGYKIVILQD